MKKITYKTVLLGLLCAGLTNYPGVLHSDFSSMVYGEQVESSSQIESSSMETTSNQEESSQEITKPTEDVTTKKPDIKDPIKDPVKDPVQQPQAPNVPVLKVKQYTYKSAKLYWNKSQTATGYKLYRSQYKNKGYKCIKTFKNKNILSYIDKGIKKQKKYYYKITAYNKEKTSKPSRPVSFISTVKVPEFQSSRQMVKGQSFYVNFMQMTKDAKVKVKSSDKNVVKVTKKGKLTAKRCGSSTVTMQVKKDTFTYKMSLKINVVYSSLYKEQITRMYTTVSKTKKRQKAAVTQQLLVGDTFKIKINQLAKTAKVTYSNSNPEVVSLSQNGTVTGLKKGTARIIARVKQEGYTYTQIWDVQVKKQPSTKVREQDINAFLGKGVFIGDSVTVGFRNYAIASGKNFMGGAKFFCGVSFSLFNNLLPVSGSSVHPVYKGGKRTIEDAVRLMNADRAYIILGVNDMFSGIDTACENYRRVLDKIRAKNPGIELYVVSCTYVARGGEREKLNNANIREFNRRMRAYCDTVNDTEYIELGKYLVDSYGYIKKEYSSDGYVHLVHKTYQVWERVFREHAKSVLKKTKAQNMITAQAYEALATAKESCLTRDYKAAKKKIKKIANKNIRKSYLTQCNAITLKDKKK